MSRAVIVIHSDADRQRASRWCLKTPSGCRIEFKEVKRSLPQNDRMYAMLTDIAKQATHHGRKYGVNEWKAIFLQALGRETQFIPSLSGAGFIPLGLSSSDLSKAEMSDLIELMQSWAAENNVTFHEPEIGRAA